jgi:hypothetical protein
MTNIDLQITGIEKIVEIFDRFPRTIDQYLGKAGKEAGDEVLKTVGLRSYPPATAANAPPTPYYIRGRGTQYRHSNSFKSERYGSRFYVVGTAGGAIVGNTASYARFLGGDEQTRVAEKYGWKKLYDVAVQKIGQITEIYNAWVAKLIRDLGL